MNILEAISLSFKTDMRSEIRGYHSKLYVRRKKEPPKQKMNQEPKAMLRCLRIRGGTVALSPFHNCTAAKAIPSSPKTTKSAMILPMCGQLKQKKTMVIEGLRKLGALPLPQWYFDPPHCNASRRQIMQGTKNIVPIGSNCFARSRKPIEFSFSRGGEVKKSTIPSIVTAYQPVSAALQVRKDRHLAVGVG